MKGKETIRKVNGQKTSVNTVPFKRIPLRLSYNNSLDPVSCFLLVSLELVNDPQYKSLSDPLINQQVKELCPVVYNNENVPANKSTENSDPAKSVVSLPLRPISSVSRSFSQLRSFICRRSKKPSLVVASGTTCVNSL